MVPDGLKRFLEERAGLKPREVPAVLTTFMFVKWATWGIFAAAGVRYRPLQRAFATANRRVNAEVSRRVERGGRMGEAIGRLEERRGDITSQFKRINVSTNTNLSRWEWLGGKYRHYSGILSTQVASYSAFRHISHRFGVEPGPFALGIAEGMILYKLTFLVHAPLELYLVVKMFQKRSGKEEEMSTGETLGREVSDIVDLGVIVYNDDGDEEGFQVVISDPPKPP